MTLQQCCSLMAHCWTWLNWERLQTWLMHGKRPRHFDSSLLTWVRIGSTVDLQRRRTFATAGFSARLQIWAPHSHYCRPHCQSLQKAFPIRRRCLPGVPQCSKRAQFYPQSLNIFFFYTNLQIKAFLLLYLTAYEKAVICRHSHAVDTILMPFLQFQKNLKTFYISNWTTYFKDYH